MSKILDKILNNEIVGISTYPEGTGQHVMIVLEIVTGENYEEIAKALESGEFNMVRNDGKVESWFRP
jgi:hypothetical protein